MQQSLDRSHSTPWSRLERASARRLRAALATSVVLVMLGLITHGHYAASGDAVHYMMIARSIVLDGDLDLGNDYGDPTNILSTPAEDHAIRGRGGVLRPVHDVGLPMLSAPYFAVAYRLADRADSLPESFRRRARLDRFIALRQLVSVFVIALTAWLAVVFFDTAWALTGEKALSWICALIWTLSPPILTHGYVFLTEVPTALLALLAYRHRESVTGSPGRSILLGATTGLLVLVHVRNVGLVLAFVLLSLWRVRSDPRRALSYFIGIGAIGVLKAAINLLFWGTVLTSPHAQLAPWPGMAAFVAVIAERVIGLLVDPRHGLLLWAPLYLAAPVAWLLLWRKSRTMALEFLIIVLGYVVFIAMPMTNVHGWRGGWSPAARFLVPIAPFALLALPAVMADKRGRWFVAALLCVQLPLDAFLWGHPMLTWSEGVGPSPLLEAILGARLADRIPAVDGLTRAAMLVVIGVLVLWSASTRALFVRRASDDD